MTLDYFYGQTGELFSFYRIPKALFQEQRFQSLSTDAKTLYGILLDRMSLSVKNGWLDKQNRVFIIFTIEDVKRALCCADNKATKLLRELEKFGLIERKRRGQGKPSLVYVKNFSAESSKESVKNRDNDDSCGFKIACQDPAKSRCNKTKENDTEMSETNLFYSEESDGMSKRAQLEEYFSQSLEVDLLLRLCPDDEDTMDSQIFLGGSEPTTLKDLAEALGKETIDSYNNSDTRGNSPSYGTNYQKLGHELMSRDELAVLDGGKCILQLRGVRPFLSDKYDLTQHPNYKLTSDYDPKNALDIEKYLSHKEKIHPDDQFALVDVDSLPPA